MQLDNYEIHKIGTNFDVPYGHYTPYGHYSALITSTGRKLDFFKPKRLAI